MDFEFPRGDTKRFKFQLKDSEGNILILSDSDQIYFTVKDNSRSTTPLIQKKIGSGIVYNSEDGYYYVTINPSDTNSLDYRSYGYDIELKSTDLVKTLVTGEITLTEEYTFASNE
jgi:hypothetical protein